MRFLKVFTFKESAEDVQIYNIAIAVKNQNYIFYFFFV